ncbi:MAG: hypothetical protein U1E86_18920 [Burkholderiaceae bacterium]
MDALANFRRGRSASDRRAEVYVPTHALASEIADKIRAQPNAPSVTVIAGRQHIMSNGKPMCAKADTAAALAHAGVDINTSLCESKTSACPYRANCPYIGQFAPATVTIYTHAHLPLHRSRLEPRPPDKVVIDEGFFLSCIDIFHVPIATLLSGVHGPVCSAVFGVIHGALANGRPLLAELAAAGVNQAALTAALRELARKGQRIDPAMPSAEQRKLAGAMREVNLLRRMLRVLGREVKAMERIRTLTGVAPRVVCHCLSWNPRKVAVTVHEHRRIQRFRGYASQQESDILVIDATANRTLIGRFVDVAQFEVLRAPRNATVVQCGSSRCSTTSLVPGRNDDPKGRSVAAKRRKELEHFVGELAKRHRKVLVVGPQAITGNPRAKLKPTIKVPKNVTLEHFNAIRGIDRWKDYDAVVVIGRNEPPIEAVEAVARAVFMLDPTPLKFAAGWSMKSRGYRLRRGLKGVGVVCHPDDRVQAVLEQVREAESEQAIDRLRLVHSPTKKEVYILSNIPLDIDVDYLYDWHDMVVGARVVRALETCGGVLPTDPKWLAKRFRRLWPSAAAAESDVRRWRKDRQVSNGNTISNLTIFEFAYRPAGSGQRSWSKCLSRSSDARASQAALEGLIGKKVVLRDAARASSSAASPYGAATAPPRSSP